jgi:methyl-accepting chemotaxis protein
VPFVSAASNRLITSAQRQATNLGGYKDFFREDQLRLTLGKKLGLGFGSILALMVLSSLLTYVKASSVQKTQERAMGVRVPTIKALISLQRELNQTQSKGRQAILAGNQTDRAESAMRLFTSNWDDIAKDIAALDELAPKWSEQENRDRLAETKTQLAILRQVQETAIKHATGDRDAVTRAGNEFADQATPVNEAMKKPLGGMAEYFATNIAKDADTMSSQTQSMYIAMGVATFLALGVGIFVAIFLSRAIVGATQSVLGRTQAIAGGDLTLPEMRIESNDELGDMTQAINKMQSSLSHVIQSMRGTAEQVAAASEELSATSQQITANSEETTAQAKVVSEAGHQVNTNLQTLASGAEEMNSTIGEIAKNATEAARVSGEAVVAADSANETVSKLGDSSVEIEKVIEVITSIAQQTNLLALNATIEAARAGEAGKGFAVVANEVKELAKQTAKATEEIKQKISVIRENTGGAVTAIGGIKGVIDKVSHISTVIATAVEEQSATTSEMARNVTEAARGASTISDNIKGVADAAQNTSTNVGEAQTATEHLSKMANQLRDLVGQFRVGGENAQAHGSIPKAARHAAGRG